LVRGASWVHAGTERATSIGLATQSRQRERAAGGGAGGDGSDVRRRRADGIGRIARRTHVSGARDVDGRIVGFQLRATVTDGGTRNGHFENLLARQGIELDDPMRSISVYDANAEPN